MAGRSIRTIAVIGGRGQMGALFVRRSREAGLKVRTADRPLTRENVAAAVDGADLLLLSVPVPAMAEVLALAAPLLAPGTILADVCSVKVRPMAEMTAAYPGPVVGTHPLFGGEIPEGFEPRVAVAPGRDDAPCREAAEAVSAWTKAMGFVPFATTAEEHDLAAAYIQGLNFTSTVAFLAAAREVPGIERFVTPSFGRRLDAARKMLTQDKSLFVILSDANPFSQEAVRTFRNFLNIAAGGDLDLLADHARWWWREDMQEGNG